jgi:hypothetical protein
VTEAFPATAGNASLDGMVLLAGGRFAMGAEDAWAHPDDGEGPVREVRIGSYWIDACNLGYLLRASAPSEALARFRESLTVSREMEEPRTIAYCLEGGAGIIAAQGNFTQAATLLGAASSIRAPTGMGVAPSRKRMADTVESQCREALSAEALSRAWGEGGALDVTAAADWALRLWEETE